MSYVLKYVAKHVRTPRYGPMYARCETCNQQIFLPLRVGLQPGRAILLLSVKMRQHIQRHHAEECHGKSLH